MNNHRQADTLRGLRKLLPNLVPLSQAPNKHDLNGHFDSIKHVLWFRFPLSDHPDSSKDARKRDRSCARNCDSNMLFVSIVAPTLHINT